MKNLAIICARKNSQRLKNKNLLKIGDQSLIEMAINSAIKSKQFTDIIISSDDEKILKLNKKYTKLIFEERKKKLSGSKVRVVEVVLDILNRRNEYDNAALLLPTCPFRVAKDINNAFSIFFKNKLNTVSVTNYEFPPELSIFKIKNFYSPGKKSPLLRHQTRSQDHNSYLKPNGAIFISPVKRLLKTKNFYNIRMNIYRMPRERSIDIDTRLDFKIAKFLYERK